MHFRFNSRVRCHGSGHYLVALALTFVLSAGAGRADDDPFQAGVRPTAALTPAQQQATFTVPEGFIVELVAAEPDILKPLNMAFDAHGRLWVTVTQEYPYAAPLDRPRRDAVKVLEDRDGDGTFESITTFADDLNIPIGIYPYRQGAIVFSIPHIWNLQDTDGDGVADQRTPLYGPMGYERDTHGMNNAFRRGYDGWLYACHGFNNETRVAGSDGHEIHMQSGNTYRMRLDGSRVEHFTWGQVNPYGMTMDGWFNLFTADCHSKPIYQLLRGGYYPSFGKPHDGLGFVPPMMDHLHGSTAIAGVAYYDAPQFPAEFQGNMFSGNVMTSRVNRNSLIQHGSTYRCQEEPDFVVTTDPWFRPVDVQVGPDGALYIADFYNRIIGHYEVPLEHPGRDRTSGRIWRVRYVGVEPEAAPAVLPHLAAATDEQLVARLGDKNLTCRVLALHELVDERGPQARAALEQAWAGSENEHQRALTLWALERLGGAGEEAIRRAVDDPAALVRMHAIKLLAERAALDAQDGQHVRAALRDASPLVRRAAADALAQHPECESVEALLRALREAAAEDALLVQGLRIAVRNQLSEPERYTRLASYLAGPQADELAGISQAVGNPASATFLLDYLASRELPAERFAELLQHAARHVAPEQVDQVIAFARERYANQLELQRTLLTSVAAAVVQRGAEASPALRSWGTEVASQLLASIPAPAERWRNEPLAERPRVENPWVVESRASVDGQSGRYLSSLPRGESLTGRLRCPELTIPAELTFFIAGHSGPPDRPRTEDNYVQLVAAETGQVLMRTSPPRNDVAQPVHWDLSAHAGKRGYIEIVDGDTGSGYAWLAVGRFQPAVVQVPAVSPHAVAQLQQAAAQTIGGLRLESLAGELEPILRDVDGEPASRAAAAAALLTLNPAAPYDVLVAALAAPLPPGTWQAAVEALVQRDHEQLREALGDIMQAVPARTQSQLAAVLAGSREGAQLLLDVVSRGRASPRLLLEKAVAERLEEVGDQAMMENAEQLTRGLPSPGEAIAQLLVARREAFRSAPRSHERGAEVFKKSCANCHQVAGQGAVVGPQLDGIGGRGLERLLEDVLDPNRNVDVAFRTTALALSSGKVVTGLLRREEGESLVLVDDKGQEFTVSKSDIEEQRSSPLSLMPENVATTLEEGDFHNLIAFLMSNPPRAEP